MFEVRWRLGDFVLPKGLGINFKTAGNYKSLIITMTRIIYLHVEIRICNYDML
jgi:hypothetical protein